ncbi:hypothetical protein [Mahella australiensis]|uniref:Uncharacterized protein n=1 Tax=Mahella australiensis (strain DSM 15567 / CIP 107919 / 50-1 BON) TaxID=697281 RepID=F3ZZW9_MAHA5|nr:hypothetical protein [Mahella australiensis]AEE95787.1 hypothetical protein Mahau_0584 [Mahella australiensis 50-1 BON]
MALIHQIFQRTGITPDEFWGKPDGARKFMLASMMLQIESEEKQMKEAGKSGR